MSPILMSVQAGLWKLRLTMGGTVALIIAITTLAFSAILWWFDILNFTSLIIIVTGFNILQWLIAPYIVNSMYNVRKIDSGKYSELQSTIERISQRSDIKTPKLMLSSLNIPNAFAYGSPLTGNMVAVTDDLLNSLDSGEVEAVLGHEVGHLKHRDMQVMMVVSLLPSLFYLLAQNLMWSGMYGSRDRKNNGSGLALVGGLSLVIYFILTLLNLGLSRQREYFADRHSASVVDNGAYKLSTGLAKISSNTWRQQSYGKKTSVSSFKALFITDPDRARIENAEIHADNFGRVDDTLVDRVINRPVSGFDRFMELFSTHPNIVKRLKALKSLQ